MLGASVCDVSGLLGPPQQQCREVSACENQGPAAQGPGHLVGRNRNTEFGQKTGTIGRAFS